MFDSGEENGSLVNINEENIIFALDIGTRTVIGVVVEIKGNRLKVLAQSIIEHESRAVFDGQIHDILKVAQAVKRVKNDLEAKLKIKLKKVAIAAAGRSLKTRFAHEEQEIGEDIEITPIVCRGLEMDAVKEAHRQLRDESGDSEEEFYCVGYTVISYYLNNYSITSLIGHCGKRVGVDLLATFLPNSVVNSLYAVLARVNLEPVSLTLEPIAAAAAIIPDSYRLLNLALLDIGAGTSDIAITKDGSVVAYGMVPIAGDEITEALAKGCLIDFNTAEIIKREIAKGENITFTDIMGSESTVSCAELLAIIDPVLESLTARVSEEILRLNDNKSPKSVFCVGGGGQIPTFTERIAQKLNLDIKRVGLRGRNFIADLIVDVDEISGPEGVTVIGISRVAMNDIGHNLITLNINGNDFRLFHSRDMTVVNALGLIEYNLHDLVGKNGRDLRFVINGERKVIYGGLCKPAEVFVNGEMASLKTELNAGDCIIVKKALQGQDARVFIKDFYSDYPVITLEYNGQEEIIKPYCFINGKLVSPDCEIAAGDRIEIKAIKSIHQLASLKNINLNIHDVFINGRNVSGEVMLNEGDRIELVSSDQPSAWNLFDKEIGFMNNQIHNGKKKLN